MEWFKDFLKSLPLEEISEQLAKLVMWWSKMVQDVPADELPLRVYLIGSIIVCFLWYFIARILPRPVNTMSWIVIISVLFTPAVSLGTNAEIVPACVGIVYSILMKNGHDVIMNILPILTMIITSFFLVFMWQVVQLTLVENSQQRPINLSKELKTFVKSTIKKYKKAR